MINEATKEKIENIINKYSTTCSKARLMSLSDTLFTYLKALKDSEVISTEEFNYYIGVAREKRKRNSLLYGGVKW